MIALHASQTTIPVYVALIVVLDFKLKIHFVYIKTIFCAHSYSKTVNIWSK